MTSVMEVRVVGLELCRLLGKEIQNNILLPEWYQTFILLSTFIPYSPQLLQRTAQNYTNPAAERMTSSK